MTRPVAELKVPPNVVDDGGDEILRAFSSRGGLSVTLTRGFQTPDPWGLLLADVVRHIGRIYANQDGVDAQQVEARILTVMADQFKVPANKAKAATVKK
jgi:hypothetical protein